MNKSGFRNLIFALWCVIGGLMAVQAQEFRGTITGTVSDPQGAVVPSATVTVRNIQTNVSATVNTNEQGVYTFPLLQPGQYAVSAAANDFQTTVRENITLNVEDRLTIDFQLEIGTTSEVNVIADTALVETASVTTGTIVTQRQIEELPLAEGAAYNLATQAPGVSFTGNPQFSGPTANGNLAGFRTNGAPGNQITLDGSPNYGFDGQVAYTPPADAVNQFKIQTNAFDAQNGFTAGSTVNVAVKSGTNELHGSAYYFDRSKVFTANNFFSNRAGEERPDRKYYRYGGQVNGPVVLPKLFNGRDRTFFMFAYENQLDRRAEPEIFTVPTALMRQGNFSEILPSTPIFDPATARLGANGVVTRTAFAGNIIPTNRINPAAQAFLNLYPLPNQAGVVDNYFSNQVLNRPYKSYLTRLDHQINDGNRIFGKFFYSKSDEDRLNFINTPDAFTRGFEFRTNKGGNLNYTSTLTSTFVLDVRAGLNEFEQQRVAANPISAADLGFTAIAALSDSTVLPRFDFRNYDTLGPERSDFNEGLTRPFRLFSLQPTATQIIGTQTLKYGYDFRRLAESRTTNGFNAGRFFFDGTYTAPASNSNATQRNLVGREAAAFLLGIPTASNTQSLIEKAASYNVSSRYHSLFIQDDWRVTPRLTLNLGLRYELESGVREAQGRIITGFDTTATNPLRAGALANFTANPPAGVPITAFQNLAGGLTFANSPNDANQASDKNNFQPRVGIAYSLNDKTVIRGGFGIFTSPFQIQAVDQTGFAAQTLFVPSTNNGLTFIATLDNPFPNGIRQPVGSSLGLATFTGRDLITTNATGPTTAVLPFERANANYARFIAGIQREIPFRIGVEATFVYSRGYDLPVLRQLNFIPREYLNDFSGVTDAATITSGITAVNTFLNANVPNPFRGLVPDNPAYNAATIARRNLLTPFPQLGNLAVTEYNGSSEYRSLQLQATKRVSQGLSFNSSYTFARDLERTRRLNPQDEELTEQLSTFDRPHRFTFSGVYELPIGRNRLIGNNWGRIADALLGGWQFQGVYEAQSGEPLLVGNFFFNGDASQLRNRLGEYDEQGRRYGVDIPAFETSGFRLADGTTPGFGNNYTITGTNVLRTFPLTLDNFRNQPFTKFDTGFTKNFRTSENTKLQLRIEAINVLNYVYFAGLNLDPTNANFGRANTQRNLPRDIQIGGRFTF